MPFGAMLGSFGVQVGGCGGLSWRFWSLFGVYVGYCRAQMGVCEVQRPQGRGLEGLGLAHWRLGTPLMQHHEWNTHNCSLRCSHSCFSSSHRSYCSHSRMTAMVQSPKRNHSSMNPVGSACSAFCSMPRARGTAISLLGCRKKESGSDVSWNHEVDQ